jgi:hypothetical protein
MDYLSSSSHHRTHARISIRTVPLSLSPSVSRPTHHSSRPRRAATARSEVRCSIWMGGELPVLPPEPPPQREDAPATPRLWRQAKRAPDSTPPGSCETAKLLMLRGSCASGVACDLVQHILGGGRWRWVGGGITLVLLQLQATQSMPRGEG